MGVLSNEYSSKVLDALFNAKPFTQPTNIYFHLYNTDPQASDTGVEVTGGGYTKVDITGKMSTPQIINGVMTISNTSKVQLPRATAPWTDANFYAVKDNNNKLLAKEALLVTAKTTVGDAPEFEVGELIITLV